jgi:hypothetical protein
MANMFLEGFRDHIIKNPSDPIKDKRWLEWVNMMINRELPRVQISMQHREGAEVSLGLNDLDVEGWVLKEFGNERLC